ncbi:hypothetical protein JQX13_28925 [Archangium violaceum]|uniref:hypothetical protein n=1 Tax=Archangium violaceum TaxID=83451 RepID=UPI00193AE273|nr:hypothetical protein [Archangium violaceum]QRK04287.1 hypothetical protein JQX13_28925 [Archangium violaceum]
MRRLEAEAPHRERQFAPWFLPKRPSGASGSRLDTGRIGTDLAGGGARRTDARPPGSGSSR